MNREKINRVSSIIMGVFSFIFLYFRINLGFLFLHHFSLLLLLIMIGFFLRMIVIILHKRFPKRTYYTRWIDPILQDDNVIRERLGNGLLATVETRIHSPAILDNDDFNYALYEEDPSFYIFMEKLKYNPKIRTCYICFTPLYFHGYYNANQDDVKLGKRTIEELLYIWESKDVELLCCSCFDIYNQIEDKKIEDKLKW